MRQVCSLLVAATLVPTLAFSQAVPQEGGPRIRPTDQRLGEILRDGAERSPTLRKLVELIEAGNVVVYLEAEPNLRGSLLGALTWIGANDTFRFVRAAIKVRPKSNALVASIAHELQHVVEVVNAPWVNDDKTLRALYNDIGKRTSVSEDVWDTAAARWTTQQVLRELNGVASTTENADDR
jgi:hypothetical protein